ncbi:MAG: tryptophan 7-halogenase [Polyangiaceae bacterium]|nr:tryptophan 7-halogenase [Polyangiaceae bacterium]
MNSLPTFDLTVVGAGPAGTAAAIVAQKAGLRVSVIESAAGAGLRAGESLAPAALRALRRLGVQSLTDVLDSSEYKPCSANVSAWGSDAWIYRDALSSPEGGGFHILRHRFDAGLRMQAQLLGVTLIQGRNLRICPKEKAIANWVLNVDSPDDAALTVESRFLIDATGRGATVARRLGSSRTRVSEQVAAVIWIRHPVDDVDNTSRIRSVPDGWWYTARLPQGLRVIAFHGLPVNVARLARKPSQLFEHLAAAALLPYPVDTASLVQGPITADAGVQLSQPLTGVGWLSVGDAALSFDPLSSQGILFALYSGIRGAEASVRCVMSPESSTAILAELESSVRNVFDANQRSRRLFYESERRWLDEPYWRAQRGKWTQAEQGHIRAG